MRDKVVAGFLGLVMVGIAWSVAAGWGAQAETQKLESEFRVHEARGEAIQEDIAEIKIILKEIQSDLK